MPSEDTQFKKGQSGNPAGRPKGCLSLKQRLKAKLMENDGVLADEVVWEAVQAALKGDAQARKLVWEYIEGKPIQPVEHSGETTVAIVDDI